MFKMDYLKIYAPLKEVLNRTVNSLMNHSIESSVNA